MTSDVPGTVFLSYSHDSPDHARTVLALSNRLRSEGIDCVLDQYEVSPPEGWPRWMEREINKAQFVLMICTELYHRRVMGLDAPGKGLGIAWEGNLVYNHIYENASLNTKFIPVVLDKSGGLHVPGPLKGATRYVLPDEYENLYGRLIGKPPAERPPLGKRRSLPAREVKTDVAMLLSLPIDPDLWNKARWRSTIFMVDPKGNVPPTLGIGFTNETAAQQIFLNWLDRYGERDEFEELRVSIIEGDIAGEGPGYTVHIGADVNSLFERYKRLGILADGDFIGITGRINRMNAPNSPNLAGFKDAYRRLKTYFLAPVLVDETGQNILKTAERLQIFKGRIHFRQVSDIGEYDPDSIVVHPDGPPKGRFRV